MCTRVDMVVIQRMSTNHVQTPQLKLGVKHISSLGFCFENSSTSHLAMAMKNTVSLLNVVSASRDLANRAGILIRTIFETGNLHIIDKSTNNQQELKGKQGLQAADPQTIADIAAQQLVRSSLLHSFPGISVIGEEDDDENRLINAIDPRLSLPDIYFENKLYSQYLSGDYKEIIQQDLDSEEVCIWLDPIDGTKEYTEGIKNAVTCLIGIAYNGDPIAGVINRPFSDQTYFGFVDIPCLFCEQRSYRQVESTDNKEDHNNGNEDDNDENKSNEILQFDQVEEVEKIECITVLSAEDFKKRDSKRRIVLCSRSHLDKETEEYIGKCKADSVIQQGGAGGKVLMILEGGADSYVYCAAGTKKWDTCAPQALLEAIGGAITEPNGAKLDYSSKAEHRNGNGIIATWNGETHASYCKL